MALPGLWPRTASTHGLSGQQKVDSILPGTKATRTKLRMARSSRAAPLPSPSTGLIHPSRSGVLVLVTYVPSRELQRNRCHQAGHTLLALLGDTGEEVKYS